MTEPLGGEMVNTGENAPKNRKQRYRTIFPIEYDPLGTCPPEKKDRYRNAALKAKNGSWPAIVKLKCLECNCWDAPEVKRCEISGCALWPKARTDLCEREPVKHDE